MAVLWDAWAVPRIPSVPSGTAIASAGFQAGGWRRGLSEQVLHLVDHPALLLDRLAAELGETAQQGDFLFRQVARVRHLDLHGDHVVAATAAAEPLDPL